MQLISIKPRYADVFLLLGNSYVHDNGTKFVQNLCHHLRHVDGTKPTETRDLDEAVHEMTQEISKEILSGSCDDNESPIYQSTAAGKKFEFQVVPPAYRCTQIHYYVNNNCEEPEYLKEFIAKMKNYLKFTFHKFK